MKHTSSPVFVLSAYNGQSFSFMVASSFTFFSMKEHYGAVVEVMLPVAEGLLEAGDKKGAEGVDIV